MRKKSGFFFNILKTIASFHYLLISKIVEILKAQFRATKMYLYFQFKVTSPCFQIFFLLVLYMVR